MRKGLVANSLSVMFFLFAHTAVANESYLVMNPTTGQNVFEVVVKSDKQDTDDKPGIYVINRSGKSSLVLSGDILGASRSFNGILDQANFGSGNSDLTTALTILNGELVLFNKNSKPNSATSKIVLSSSRTPVVDPTLGLPAQIPIIENISDISVSSMEIEDDTLPQSAKTILISLKAPSPLGNGITFAVIAEAPEKASSPPKIHRGQAILINYQFLNDQQLAKLIGNGKLIFSHSVAKATLQSLHEHLDHPIIKAWKNHIETYIKYIETSKVKKTSPIDFIKLGQPRIDLLKGTVVYDALPSQKIMSEPFEVSQVYDPRDKVWKVRHTSDEDIYSYKGSSGLVELHEAQSMEPENHLINGKIQIKNGNYHIKTSPSLTSTTPNYLFFSEGSAVVMVPNSDGHHVPLSFDKESLATHRKIEFAHRMAWIDSKFNHFIFMSSISQTGKNKTQVHIFQERSPRNLQYLRTFDLTNKFFTLKELEHRIFSIEKPDTKEVHIAFDTLTPAKGVRAYENKMNKDNQIKTPVLDLGHAIKTNSTRFLHLFPKKDVEIIKEKLTFREYVEVRSTSQRTGFYLGEMDDSPFAVFNVPFFPGQPVINKHRKGSDINRHILEQVDFKVGNSIKPNAKLSLLPFTPNISDSVDLESVKSELSILATSDDKKTDSAYENITLPHPAKGLIGAKIVKGIRSKENEFTVLLFYGKSETNGQGVWAAHGRLIENYTMGRKSLNLELTAFSKIDKNLVNPQSLKHRLKADGPGNYYWVVDPDLNPTASNYRVIRLADENKRMIRINQPGAKVQLRFQEEFTQNPNSESFFNGNWHIMAGHDVVTRLPQINEYISSLRKLARKAKKKSASKDSSDPDGFEFYEYSYGKGELEFLEYHKIATPAFSNYLEDLVNPELKSQSPKHQIILVEDRLKETYLRQMMVHAMYEGKYFSLSHRSAARQTDLYLVDPTSTKGEIQNEFKHIRSNAESRNSAVLADAASLLEAEDIQDIGSEETAEEDGDEEAYEGAGIAETDNPLDKVSMWTLLASEGQATNVRTYRKIARKGAFDHKVPMVILATPDEWRKMREDNEFEDDAGVFKSFELNANFLTSSWTLWSPRSENATEEIKEAAKVPLTAEEFKVFPTTEEILSRATAGEDKGRQRIVVVPEEIKPLITKIIRSRWANPDSDLAGAWHYSNDDLSVFEVQEDHSTQENVVDNFRAMKGSAENKNVVLLGDMERILKIGRPYSDSNQYFQIRDPAAKKVKNDIFLGGLSNQDSENENNPLISKTIDEIDKVKTEIENLKEALASSSDDEPGPDPEEIKKKEAQLLTLQFQLTQLTYEVSDQAAAPHLMWWIAAEGEKIQPKSKNDWSLQSERSQKINSIILSTETELEQLQQDLAFESKFFDVTNHFEVVRLEAPDEKIKYELIDSLFNKPEIRSMEYLFSLEDKAPEDARRQLIYHFVNRVEQIAIQNQLETTPAFIRAFTELRRSLVEDVSLRRKRKIDRNYLERLFSKVFPMSINLDNLEEGDPLLRLKNIEEAGREMQRLGYHGPMELKQRTLETVLSQTRGADPGRPIPNSQIFYGDTSSGKTFLFRTIIKMLGLEDAMYDSRKSNNEEAQAIIINVQNLTEDETNESGKMSVDQAVEAIQDLLAMPNGHRSFILIDDAHKAASAKIQQVLFSFIQSLFEAEGGLIPVKRKGSTEVREVPVQNINLYMTVNPTANKDLIKRYVDEDKSLTKLVLAALARDGYNIEDSFLARWSDIINIDSFPRGAKVPALVERIRQASQGSDRMVLVDPNAIGQLVDLYPKAHAREFLSPAASAITSIPALAEPASLYMVSPHPGANRQTKQVPNDGYLSSTELQRSIRDLTQINPVTAQNTSSQLNLVSFFVNNLRTQLYNYMALEASNSDILKMPVGGLKSLSKTSFISALVTHLAGRSKLPVSELIIRGDHFSYFSQAQLEELLELQKERAEHGDFFPVDFSISQVDHHFNPDGFIENRSFGSEFVKSRKDILSEYSRKVHGLLLTSMATYMRWPQHSSIDEALTWPPEAIEQWFSSLPQEDQIDGFKSQARQIVELFKEFQVDLYDPNLKEMRSEKLAQASLTMAQQAKLFMFVVDKAISHLPWGVFSKFSQDVVESATDLSLGQKPAFIQYAYHHDISPFAIVTPDFLNQSFAAKVNKEEFGNSSTISGENAPDSEMENEFMRMCMPFLGESGEE